MNKSNLIKELINTESSRVAEYQISGNSRGREHIHNHVFEELYCLSGRLIIEISDRHDVELNPGETVFIPRGMKHCVNNADDNDARFLVVQGDGKFDLVKT